MIEGHDVSKWQPEEFHVEGIDFVIIEVTKGMEAINPKLAAQTAWARKNGLSVGFYHFSKPGDMVPQADLFLSLTPYQAGDHFWFDWEDDGVTCAQKDEWIKYVDAKRPTYQAVSRARIGRLTRDPMRSPPLAPS